MADKVITVDPDGTVSELKPTVRHPKKVIWKGSNTTFDFTVAFSGDIPFEETRWLDGSETGNRVDGNTKPSAGGRKRYPYSVSIEKSDSVSIEKSASPTSGPELIVDGGRGLHGKNKAKKAKKSKAANRAKTTKPLAKGRATKKSKANRAKAKRAARPRASKKR